MQNFSNLLANSKALGFFNKKEGEERKKSSQSRSLKKKFNSVKITIKSKLKQNRKIKNRKGWTIIKISETAGRNFRDYFGTHGCFGIAGIFFRSGKWISKNSDFEFVTMKSGMSCLRG